jgi:chromosome segregation ATPase
MRELRILNPHFRIYHAQILINEVKDGSIASYVRELAEKKAELQNLEKLVAEVHSEYQSLLQNKKKYEAIIPNLKKQTETLFVKKADIERQANEVRQNRDLILRECNQIKAVCKLECSELRAKLSKESTKYIHDLLKNDNDNPKLEALAAPSMNSSGAHLGTLYSYPPITMGEY